MELFAIRNNKQREELIETIKNYRLPFKTVLQDIYPHRSVKANAYYWVILTKLSEELDHTPKELHDFFIEINYKVKKNIIQKIKGLFIKSKATPEEFHMFFRGTFLLQYRPDKTGKWSLRIVSTTELDQVEFMNYCLHIRGYSMVNWGINLPLPNEVIINE